MTANLPGRVELLAVFVCGVLMASGRVRGAGNEPEDAFAFGIVADAQYCDADPEGSRWYRESREKLADCVDKFKAMDLAFAIHLGDFIDRDFASFDAVSPIFDRLRMPHYHLLGNHDFAVAEPRKPEVPRRLGLTRRYYGFEIRGWRFLALDGNDLSLVARQAGDAEYAPSQGIVDELRARQAPHAQIWNGGLGEQQLDWLDDQLSTAAAAAQRVIVFCHFPVYPPDKHNLWNDTEVVELLERHTCLAAWINGHNHAGNYAQRRAIHYLTVPGMVETADTTAYGVVRVCPSRLEIQGYGRVPSRVLELR